MAIDFNRMPRTPGTCALCGKDTMVYALEEFTCRKCAEGQPPAAAHDHSWAEDMDEVRACCPDHNPLLAGTGIRCPGDPAARHEAVTTTDPKGAPMSGPCDDDDCCDDCCEGED